MSTGRDDSSRPIVLVVEDDSSVREALALILDDSYEVLFAEDGPPALKLVLSQHPAVVLLDLGLPTMSGLDLLATIKASLPALPIIVVTITRATEAIVKAMKLGAFDYLTKPYRDQEVLAKIRDALNEQKTPHHTTPQGNISSSPLQPGCLILAGHLGTAATLKLILERYATTYVATDGIDAVQSLGAAVPDCVLCDERGWAAEGAAFVRALRSQYPMCRVALLTTDDGGHSRDTGYLVDALIPERAGLSAVVRHAIPLCLTEGSAASPVPRIDDSAMRAVDYMRLHYAEVVRIEAIARAADFSRSRLSEVFRIQVGFTLSRYLIALRVEVAALLLRRTSLTVEEVASQAGFCHSAHLSRAFQSQTGHRPGAYRRQLWQCTP
jgi:DNA-binding response OmpR family regulator/AraC-like DNA-binding protein